MQCEPSGPSTSAEGASPISPRLTTDISETLHTLIIPTQPALQLESLTSYRRVIQPWTGSSLELTDLKSYNSSTFSAQAEVVVRSTVVNQGPCGVAIETFSFLPVGDAVMIFGWRFAQRQRRQWRTQESNFQVAHWMEMKTSFLCVRINLHHTISI